MLRVLFAMLASLAIAGCASLPESAYVMPSGCAIAQWNKKWVEANVASMTWDGGCKSGLASGHGTHTVALKNGKTKRHVGEMSGGFMTGKGEYAKEDGWRLKGYFFEANLIAGEVYGADGRLVFSGSMVDKGTCNGKNVSYRDQRYKEGDLHLRDGSYIQGGRYDSCVGMYAGSANVNVRTGAGIVYGKHVKDGQVISWFVDGKSFSDDSSYMRAKQDFLERDKIVREQQEKRERAELDRQIATYEAEQKERAARDRKEALAMLGGAATAAAGGRNSKERTQNVISALGGGSAGAGNGNTQIWELEFKEPGIEKMTHCIKLHPATLPISRKLVIGGLPASLYEPRNDPQYRLEPQFRVDDRDVPDSRRAVLIENTCAEKIHVYYAACFEQRTNVASSDGNKSWSAGKAVGMTISNSPGVTYPVWTLEKGQYAYLGETYTEKSRTWNGGDPSIHKVLAQIGYGAWQGDFLNGPTIADETAAGTKFRKKHIAMRTVMGKTYFSATYPEFGSRGRGGSPLFVEKDQHVCSELNLQEAWNAAR